jgi:hypothetical protein
MEFTFQVLSETIMSLPISIKTLRGEKLVVENITLSEFTTPKGKEFKGAHTKYTVDGESSKFSLYFNEDDTVFTTGFGVEPFEGMWFENAEGRNERVKERPAFDNKQRLRVTACMSNASSTAKKIAEIEKHLYVQTCAQMKLKPTKVDFKSNFKFIGDSSTMKSFTFTANKMTSFGPPIGGDRKKIPDMRDYPIDGSHWIPCMTLQPGYVQMKKNGHEWSFIVYWNATQVEFGDVKEKKPELTEEELLERADLLQQEAFKAMMDADPEVIPDPNVVRAAPKRPLEGEELEDPQPAAKKSKA